MATRIKILIAAQFTGSLFLSVLARSHDWPQAPVILHLAILFSNAGLLGLWAAVGQAPHRIRLPAVVAALTGLASTMFIQNRYGPTWEGAMLDFLIIFLPALVVFGTVSGLQFVNRPLTICQVGESQPVPEDLQFTIKQMLLITTAIAVIVAVAKWLHSFEITDGFRSDIILLAVLVPCFSIVELATFWAALGLGNPLRRLMLLLPVAGCVGVIPPLYLEGMSAMDWARLLGLQVAITAASLLIVRTCGWRLCRVRSKIRGIRCQPDASASTTRSPTCCVEYPILPAAWLFIFVPVTLLIASTIRRPAFG